MSKQTIKGDPVAWLVQWNSILPGITGHREVLLEEPNFSPSAATVTPLYAVAPVPAGIPDRDNLRDIIAQAIGGGAYDCTRVWSAWGVGTMSDDDFIPIVDQEERLYEIADACLEEFLRPTP